MKVTPVVDLVKCSVQEVTPAPPALSHSTGVRTALWIIRTWSNGMEIAPGWEFET